jgi:hypothetical protein
MRIREQSSELIEVLEKFCVNRMFYVMYRLILFVSIVVLGTSIEYELILPIYMLSINKIVNRRDISSVVYVQMTYTSNDWYYCFNFKRIKKTTDTINVHTLI